MTTPILPGDRILFQGDSITDCGRREPAGAPLGWGYPTILAGWFAAQRPDLGIEVLNRGISGDRTAELLARWDEDCLALKPQVLSIKIGVNDLWRKLGEWNGQTYIDVATYRANLEKLCTTALAGGVHQLVLVSPTSIDADNESPINRELGEYARVAQELAARLGAIWVDARTPLLAARAAHPELGYTPDGCHPSLIGHGLIAGAWWKAVMG